MTCLLRGLDDVIQRQVHRGHDGCRDRALHDRRVGELHHAVSGLQDVLDGEHGAAEVGEHHDTIALVGAMDRVAHQPLVCAQRAVRVTAGALQADLAPCHLTSQVHNASGDVLAVRNDHYTDHLVSSLSPGTTTMSKSIRHYR